MCKDIFYNFCYFSECCISSYKVTLVNSNYDKIESFEGYINNDGAFAQKENIKVNWHDDYVEIILKGGEQKDDVHLLEYRLFDDMLR